MLFTMVAVMFFPMVIPFTGKYFPKHVLGVMFFHASGFHRMHQDLHGNHSPLHVMPFVLFFFITILLVAVMTLTVAVKHLFL
jgi:hypothetical protein